MPANGDLAAGRRVICPTTRSVAFAAESASARSNSLGRDTAPTLLFWTLLSSITQLGWAQSGRTSPDI
jgi:hypothetical protein